jgi:hypothetical protein
LSDVAPGPGALVGFINQAIDAGMSATGALREFRAAGGAINNEAFYQAYGALRDAASTELRLAGLNPTAVVPGEAMTTWAAGDEGTFNTFVQAYFRVPGQHAYEQRFFIHTSDRAPTVQEAQDAAEAFFTRPDVLGYLGEGSTLQFTVVSSVARMTGRR